MTPHLSMVKVILVILFFHNGIAINERDKEQKPTLIVKVPR